MNIVEFPAGRLAITTFAERPSFGPGYSKQRSNPPYPSSSATTRQRHSIMTTAISTAIVSAGWSLLIPRARPAVSASLQRAVSFPIRRADVKGCPSEAGTSDPLGLSRRVAGRSAHRCQRARNYGGAASATPRYISGDAQSVARQRASAWICRALSPIRSNDKHREPLTPFAEYVARRRTDGQPCDSWVRTHLRLGATVLKVAPCSIVVAGTLAEWRNRPTVIREEQYRHCSGALSPVHVSLEQDHAVYVEPNLWVRHPLQ